MAGFCKYNDEYTVRNIVIEHINIQLEIFRVVMVHVVILIKNPHGLVEGYKRFRHQ